MSHSFSLRSPVVWLLLGLPLATLIAGFYTLELTSAGSLDAVSDPVKRTAQVQRLDLSTDETTRDLGLSALMTPEGNQVKVKILPEGAIGADAALVLRLEHPIDAQQDIRIRLQPATDGGWMGTWPQQAVAWRVQLSPPHLEWRLLGRAGNASAVNLQPALSAEDSDARR